MTDRADGSGRPDQRQESLPLGSANSVAELGQAAVAPMLVVERGIRKLVGSSIRPCRSIRLIVVRRLEAPAEAPDVLDVYLGSGLSDVEIRDQVRSLIGAGYDTTAATFAWMMLRAAHTPGVWGRLRAEADDRIRAVPSRA